MAVQQVLPRVMLPRVVLPWAVVPSWAGAPLDDAPQGVLTWAVLPRVVLTWAVLTGTVLSWAGPHQHGCSPGQVLTWIDSHLDTCSPGVGSLQRSFLAAFSSVTFKRYCINHTLIKWIWYSRVLDVQLFFWKRAV